MQNLNQENKLAKFLANEEFKIAIMLWLYEIMPESFEMSPTEDISTLKIEQILHLTYIKKQKQ